MLFYLHFVKLQEIPGNILLNLRILRTMCPALYAAPAGDIHHPSVY